MTRSRRLTTSLLASTALVLLLLIPGGGQAREPEWVLGASCTTQQDTSRDFVTIRSTLRHRMGGRLRRARGKRVRSRMKDLVQENGNNVVDARDSDTTNRHGVAVTRHEFDAFGNYEVIVRAFDHGDVVATKKIHFGVGDRESGKCDPVLPSGS